MDLGGLVRAVNAAFQDGAKLVMRIRDDRADSDRALPEEATRDLLDSLQLGPLLVKGQYDRDLKRFGEQLVCGDSQAREQMKDVLINLQMALNISLRGVSMDNGELDFDALQQTSDDCRTNAGVCLGQLSQRLSEAAKAEAMIPEPDIDLPAPKFATLGYSSSRSTRSTRSSGRDSRTPTESMHDNYNATRVTSNTLTINSASKDRKRANSSASKRGYEPRRPTTPQSQVSYGAATIHVPHAATERRLRGMPSHDVLTPPDEETLRTIRNGYAHGHHTPVQHVSPRGTNGTRADSGYASASYTSRRQAPYGGVPSMASSRSNGSSRPAYAATEKIPVRTKFGGIPAHAMSYASHDSRDEYGSSTLDDPTTSEEDDILSLRRPSSHALAFDEHELLSPTVPEFYNRPVSSAKSYVVSLPDVDGHQPSSIVSAVSEGEEDESGHESVMVAPELLAANTYRPGPRGVDPDFEVDDTTPILGPGEFGHATVYETSRIRPVDTMPRDLPAPRLRQPRQDSLSRLRESRLITAQVAANDHSTPQGSLEEAQANLRHAEARVRHYRNRPLHNGGSVRAASSSRATEARPQHVAYMQQEVRIPEHLADLPLPPPPAIDQRPDSRNSPKQRTPQVYKVFPTPPSSSVLVRNNPGPPPNAAPPPPPGRGPKWLAEANSTGLRPSTSPGPPPTLQRASDPDLRPTTSAPAENDDNVSALPQDGPGPSETTESVHDVESQPSRALSKTSSQNSGQRMVKIVPMHMAMYGGVYTGPAAPKAEKPTAPPIPLTLPLVLPTEKQLLGFCKGAHRMFLGVDSKTMRLSARPVGLSGNMHFWVCHKCHFQGPVTVARTVTIGKKGKEKIKEEKMFDLKPRASPIRGLDGELGGVRYKWVFLAKCHVPLKIMTEDLAMGAGAAGRGEWGGFGCLFCCAEGVSRGWVDKDANGKLVVADGLSVRSGSTGSFAIGKNSSSGSGKGDTPLFKDLEGFMSHLEMHRKEDCWPGQEMMGRMRVIAGRRALDGEEWEVNFLPFKIETAAEES